MEWAGSEGFTQGWQAVPRQHPTPELRMQWVSMDCPAL